MEQAFNYIVTVGAVILPNILADLLLRRAEEYKIIQKRSTSQKVLIFLVIFVFFATCQLYLSPTSPSPSTEQGQASQSVASSQRSYPAATTSELGNGLIFLDQFVALLNTVPQASWSGVFIIATTLFAFQGFIQLFTAIYKYELTLWSRISALATGLVIGYAFANWWGAIGFSLLGLIVARLKTPSRPKLTDRLTRYADHAAVLLDFLDRDRRSEQISDKDADQAEALTLCVCTFSTTLSGANFGLAFAFGYLAIPGPFNDGYIIQGLIFGTLLGLFATFLTLPYARKVDEERRRDHWYFENSYL